MLRVTNGCRFQIYSQISHKSNKLLISGFQYFICSLYYSATWHIEEFGILKFEANSPSPICECIGFPDMPSCTVFIY